MRPKNLIHSLKRGRIFGFINRVGDVARGYRVTCAGAVARATALTNSRIEVVDVADDPHPSLSARIPLSKPYVDN